MRHGAWALHEQTYYFDSAYDAGTLVSVPENAGLYGPPPPPEDVGMDGSASMQATSGI